MARAGLIHQQKFLAKNEFKEKGYLGSGGVARFRDTLWAAALGTSDVRNMDVDRIEVLAEKNRAKVAEELGAGK